MKIVTLVPEATLQERRMRLGRSVRPSAPYRLLFPASLIKMAADHLWENGQHGLEQLVLWAGTPSPNGVIVTAVLMPETEATWGWVHILPAEQPRIVDWLRAHGQLLFAESHTHGDGPWATEMSDEDRRHPAGRHDGFLTIIVTGYARNGIRFDQAGVWECRDLVWRKFPTSIAHERLRIVSDKEACDALG